MSHPASLASRLHALALNDTLFPDLHHLEKAQRTRAIYRIFHTVASTAALGQEDIVDDLAPLLTLMESPCLTRQGGLCPLLASHYNLYLGTLLELGDRHHPEIIGQIEEALALRTHGLYLVTELGCGNNAMSMATEVRYDCATDGFILHTPHRHAAKFMPYIALEGQPKSSVVMARLWVGEQDCGIHPFLVPCREQLMLDYAPQLLYHGLCSPAEIVALPARQEATLDHVWEHHAARVPDEFDVRDLMAATPLGSPDLASAWFALAPSLHDPQPEG